MLIDVFFDPICPWCFIGKRRLEAALAFRPRARAEFSWRPFLLNPEMPMGGIERTANTVGAHRLIRFAGRRGKGGT